VGRWVIVGSAAKVLGALLGLGLVYFGLPLTGDFGEVWSWLTLVSGTALFGWVFVRQIRRIGTSAHPMTRAVEALVIVLGLFLVMFASVTFSLEYNQPGSYSEPLTKIDALYFTVTTLATVGFGDISPESESARVFVTFQMLVNLLFVGAALRLIVKVAQNTLMARGQGTRPSGSPTMGG
jgi:hypothetical protein